jgi:hypothetical protein
MQLPTGRNWQLIYPISKHGSLILHQVKIRRHLSIPNIDYNVCVEAIFSAARVPRLGKSS